MKDLRGVIIGGVAVVALSTLVYSFTVNKEDPKEKKYEVIRSSDGEISTYDTILPFNSTYTEQNYLDDLGFGDDKLVEIIDLMEVAKYDKLNGLEGEGHKMMFISMDSEEFDHDCEQVMKIEKHIIINEGEEFMIDLQDGNMDSIMEVFHSEFTDEKGDFIVKEMIFHDSMMVEFDHQMESLDSMLQILDVEIQDLDLLDSVEIIDNIEMNFDEADFHKVMNDEGTKIEIAYFGNRVDEDFTLLIVSDPKDEGHKDKILEANHHANTNFTMYPNPASNSTILKFNFSDEAKTEITITDINGKQIDKIKLEKSKGEVSHTLDVENWSKGVYFIEAIHGNEKIIEKLVVE